jgi:uncharacterized membrane protein
MSMTRITQKGIPDIYISVAALVIFGLFLVLAPLLGPKTGITAAGVASWALMAAFVLYALLRRRDPREVVVDERDRQIKQRSAAIAGMMLWSVASLAPVALMLVCSWHGKRTITVDVAMLPAIGMISLYVVAMAIAHIVLHWRGTGHAD